MVKHFHLRALLRAVLVTLMLAAMPAGATELVGRVVDSMDAKVFSGASVQVRGHALQRSTDANGFFRLPGMNPGAYLLEVTLPDGREFVTRLILLSNRSKQYLELDYSRIVPPDDDEEY